MNASIKNNIAKNIVKYRKMANISQKELAKIINISQSRLSNWETGANSMNIDCLLNICDVLNVSINDMYGVYPEAKINLSYTEQQMINNYRKLPSKSKSHIEYLIAHEIDVTSAKEEKTKYNDVIEIQKFLPRVSAGSGNPMFESLPSETIKIPSTYKSVSYAVGVSGNSMEPLYNDGDTLLIENSNYLERGEIGIFLKDNMAYVKKLGDNDLISINKKHPNIPLDETVRCMGRVIDKL